MPARHLAAALLVALVWGVNFVAIKVGLRDLPPLTMAALRFFLAAVPAIFFIRPPAAPWRLVVLYGLTTFAGQFGLLFAGMAAGMPAGLASLALQLQVFVTIGLAVAFAGERASVAQVIGAVVAFGGIAVIALNTGGEITPLGLGLVLLGACSWGVGNLVSKRLGPVDPLAVVAWGSLAALPPLVVACLVVEGPSRVARSLAGITWMGAASVAYIVYLSTLLGYGLWSWLLRRHPAAVIAPFTLLATVFAFFSGWLLLGEAMQSWKIAAAALVMAGLATNLFGARLVRLLPVRRA